MDCRRKQQGQPSANANDYSSLSISIIIFPPSVNEELRKQVLQMLDVVAFALLTYVDNELQLLLFRVYCKCKTIY